MMNFIPVFPLNIIVYPGEPLNLHIFEPRYKQLIKECIEEQRPFGIPVVLDKKTEEFGTLLEVTELAKEYENGEMDIKARGLQVFRVLEIIKELPDKLYSGAIVNYPENILEPGNSKTEALIISEVKRMYTLLNVEDKFPVAEKGMLSYKIGHYIGFTALQEYEMLQLFTETLRLEYIRQHLKNMLPLIQGMEQAKARIQMNGHFRDLSLGDI